MLQLPPFQITSPFSYTASRFQVTGHFDTGALKDFKITLNTKTSEEP